APQGPYVPRCVHAVPSVLDDGARFARSALPPTRPVAPPLERVHVDPPSLVIQRRRARVDDVAVPRVLRMAGAAGRHVWPCVRGGRSLLPLPRLVLAVGPAGAGLYARDPDLVRRDFARRNFVHGVSLARHLESVSYGIPRELWIPPVRRRCEP